jgi:hypothetical protein
LRGASSGFEDLLTRAGLAVEPTRGFTPVSDRQQDNADMRLFTWNVRDRE